MKNEDLFRAMGTAGDDQNQYAVMCLPCMSKAWPSTLKRRKPCMKATCSSKKAVR